jgi:hypothetical protein
MAKLDPRFAIAAKRRDSLRAKQRGVAAQARHGDGRGERIGTGRFAAHTARPQ